MELRVEQWESDLALRIASAVADEIHLKPEMLVEMRVEEGQLVVRPLRRRKKTLEELLAGITEDNLHGEIQTGPPVGGEIW